MKPGWKTFKDTYPKPNKLFRYAFYETTFGGKKWMDFSEGFDCSLDVRSKNKPFEATQLNITQSFLCEKDLDYNLIQHPGAYWKYYEEPIKISI
jgi:hypothetical protein